MKKTQKVLKFIWLEMKKYWWQASLTFILFGAMVVLSDAIAPLYIKKITDALNLEQYDSAFSLVYVLVGIYVIQKVTLYSSMQLLSYFESLLSRDLYNQSFDFFIHHSYDFYSNEFTGSLVDKVKRLGYNVITIIDTVLFNFYSLLISVSSILILLFIENDRMGFLFLVFLMVYSLLIHWMGKKMSPIYEDRSVAKTKFNATVSDIFTNIQTVLFFSSHQLEKERFKKSNQIFHEKRYHAWKNAINYQDTIGFLPPLFTSGVTLYAIHLASIGSMTVGSVILVFLLGNNFGGQIWRINRAVKEFVSSISDCIESIEIIERKPAVIDIHNPKPFSPKEGVIECKNLDFTYPEGDHVFNKFNLTIKARESVGIVGRSGSGKTTITKLLLRLYDLQKGHILFDNHDISKIKQFDLRQNIAYVPQDTILFHRSIYENIAYGNPSASKDEVYTAARLANVDEFVKDFSNGYKTMVGERGVKLSGGQRQRIGIARAMLKKDAPVLIMDEATSSLDTLSEQYIQESFDTLSKDRTTIVIAHRLSTIEKLDRILVFDNGNIVEDGSHEELLSLNGHYAELWNSQNNGFITE